MKKVYIVGYLPGIVFRVQFTLEQDNIGVRGINPHTESEIHVQLQLALCILRFLEN